MKKGANRKSGNQEAEAQIGLVDVPANSATEWRKMVAHGVSRGKRVMNDGSPARGDRGLHLSFATTRLDLSSSTTHDWCRGLPSSAAPQLSPVTQGPICDREASQLRFIADIRISDFGLPSDFGFRFSDFRLFS
jgi:hypothetical protein